MPCGPQVVPKMCCQVGAVDPLTSRRPIVEISSQSLTMTCTRRYVDMHESPSVFAPVVTFVTQLLETPWGNCGRRCAWYEPVIVRFGRTVASWADGSVICGVRYSRRGGRVPLRGSSRHVATGQGWQGSGASQPNDCLAAHRWCHSVHRRGDTPPALRPERLK